MSKKPKQEESGPKVPTYIVTYSDMVTLLLTFFVMLLSMAKTQVEEHKFMAGISSFRTAIADFGLSGFLINQKGGPDFEHPKPKYRIEEGDDEPEDRSLDAHTEMMRRILMDIESKMKISPSHISGESRSVLPTELHFDPDQSELTEEMKKQIHRHWTNLESYISGQDTIMYVLGIANDSSNMRQQFSVSAKRARTVADYLEELKPDDQKCTIYSWGAGNGGEWTGKNGIASENTHIVISVISIN